MRKKIFGILIMMLLIITLVPVINSISEIKTNNNGETLNVSWYKKYGGEGIDSFRGLDFTYDGGYIVVGETQIDESKDAWLVKIDADGEIIWETTYGTPGGWDGLYPVITTSDGGYLGGGWYYNITQDKLDALLIKTDEDGEISWTLTFGGEDNDEFIDIIEIDDGYFAVGYSIQQPIGKVAVLVKVDFSGNLIWNKNLEKEDCVTQVDSITVANEGDGYIISGGYYSISDLNRGRLIKIDLDGNILWDKSYGTEFLFDWCTTVTNTNDDNYIIVGGTHGGPIGYGFWGTDVWLMKVDNEGSIIWEHQHGIPLLKDYSQGVQPTRDGGYIFTGHTLGIGNLGYASFASWSKVWLVKTDSDGNIEWQKRMPDSGHGRTVLELDDGYILSGFHRGDHGHSSEYGFIIKTDENGNIG